MVWSGPLMMSCAEIYSLVYGLVWSIDDELSSTDGESAVGERVDPGLLQSVVDVLLLVPLVVGGGPALGDAEQAHIIDGVPATEVEHGVVGLPDKEGSHGDVARVAQWLSVRCRPVIIDQ